MQKDYDFFHFNDTDHYRVFPEHLLSVTVDFFFFFNKHLHIVCSALMTFELLG